MDFDVGPYDLRPYHLLERPGQLFVRPTKQQVSAESSNNKFRLCPPSVRVLEIVDFHPSGPGQIDPEVTVKTYGSIGNVQRGRIAEIIDGAI